jgi:hypothetical protein
MAKEHYERVLKIKHGGTPVIMVDATIFRLVEPCNALESM